jgi:hypothetical protein
MDQANYWDAILNIAITVSDLVTDNDLDEWDLEDHLDEVVDYHLTDQTIRLNDIQDYTKSSQDLDDDIDHRGVRVYQFGHGCVKDDVQTVLQNRS